MAKMPGVIVLDFARKRVVQVEPNTKQAKETLDQAVKALRRLKTSTTGITSPPRQDH